MCVCEVGGESDEGRGNSMDCYEVGGGSEGGGGNSMDCQLCLLTPSVNEVMSNKHIVHYSTEQ